MKINNINKYILILNPAGRLDAFGSKNFEVEINNKLTAEHLVVIINMTMVEYLSSAGLRVLLSLFQKLLKRNGNLILTDVQTYAKEVMKIAGFSDTFTIYDSFDEALENTEKDFLEKYINQIWNLLTLYKTSAGNFRFIPGSDTPGKVKVLGDIQDVLYSKITPSHIASKKFNETEYSIGLGGLGERIQDYFYIMGEMITIGGTMVWLPTDGNNTPDYLIPLAEGNVTIRTGFNVAIDGEFNDLIYYVSKSSNGTSLTNLYKSLFEISKRRNKDYKGAIAIAMRCEIGEAYGSGIKKSPIVEYAPSNGEMITNQLNINNWFDSDKTPGHKNVSGLICGIGADLSHDLSQYKTKEFNSAFYIHPNNTGGKSELLHNHGVFFNSYPLKEKPVNLKNEISDLINNSEFVDMRHLFDPTTIQRAFIGITYINDFIKDEVTE